MQKFLNSSVEQAASLLRPTFINEKWKRPVISCRQAAVLRKNSILNGTFGSWTEGKGGWLVEWDKTKKHTVMRPLKGHLRERNEIKRVEKIQKAMADMPKKLLEYREEKKANKPLKGLEKWLQTGK